MSNWTVKMSITRGVPYYYNSTDKKSSWNPPAGVSIGRLPGAECLRDMAKAEIFESGGLLGQIRVSHLLVKHKNSRNPTNRKGEAIAITVKEAIERAEGYLAVINGVEGGRDSDNARNMFVDLAKKFSDCSSGARGGDLGWFGCGQMQAAFEREAYVLPIRQISDVVLTTSGVHLIMKTGGAIHGTMASMGANLNEKVSEYNTTGKGDKSSTTTDENRRAEARELEEKQAYELEKQARELKEQFKNQTCKPEEKQARELKEQLEKQIRELEEKHARELEEQLRNQAPGLNEQLENQARELKEQFENQTRELEEKQVHDLKEQLKSQACELEEQFENQTRRLEEKQARELEERFDKQIRELEEKQVGELKEQLDKQAGELEGKQVLELKEQLDTQARELKEQFNKQVRELEGKQAHNDAN